MSVVASTSRSAELMARAEQLFPGALTRRCVPSAQWAAFLE